MFFRLLLTTSLLLCVTSYRHYQREIPNGDAVPHPCKINNIWEGVGHFLDDGTGYRNPFGKDFEEAGHQWTEALCRKDSDEDGLTNGEELGDPNCKWKPGDIPDKVYGLSHPGVCDPWDSPDCFLKSVPHPTFTTQEKWMREMCKADDFVCDGLSEPGMQTLVLRMPPTAVPAQGTTYECQIFDFSAEGLPDGDFHMIATEPIINNTYVMHHMVLLACTDDAQPTPEPYDCGMVASEKCTEFVSIWTVGMAGDCFHSQTGISIGTKGYKKIAIQHHWNNPEERDDYVDSSGYTIYYTANKRSYEKGMLMTGTNYFYLPPHQDEIVINSRCAPDCSRQLMTGPIYVTEAWNHMHYAGRRMSVQLKRNNSYVTHLTNEMVYSYDSPQVYRYDEAPITLFPGDEIITTCTFTTASKATTIPFGWGTYDEMCFAFITYYPKANLKDNSCLDTLEQSYCEPSSFQGCNGSVFWNNLQETQIYKDVMKSCVAYTPCLTECLATLTQYWKTDPCLNKGNNWEIIQTQVLQWTDEGKELMNRMASCKTEVYLALNPNQGIIGDGSQGGNNPPPEDGSWDAASWTTPVTSLVLLMTCLTMLMTRIA